MSDALCNARQAAKIPLALRRPVGCRRWAVRQDTVDLMCTESHRGSTPIIRPSLGRSWQLADALATSFSLNEMSVCQQIHHSTDFLSVSVDENFSFTGRGYLDGHGDDVRLSFDPCWGVFRPFDHENRPWFRDFFVQIKRQQVPRFFNAIRIHVHEALDVIFGHAIGSNQRKRGAAWDFFCAQRPGEGLDEGGFSGAQRTGQSDDGSGFQFTHDDLRRRFPAARSLHQKRPCPFHTFHSGSTSSFFHACFSPFRRRQKPAPAIMAALSVM